VRRLAAGGMAELFLARMRGDAGFFHDVVVKRLFRNLTEHESARRMFQDEAKLLAALAHPNIPQVFELGFEDGTWFMAMEHVDGYDLAALWQQGARLGRPMPLGVAIGVVMQICEGLHHAHERRDRLGQALRIVHRDVNPQNIMITRDGVAKLVDFGIARTTARRDTDANVVKGTYAYMAPEQVKAMSLDKRVDVFALGVVLYELTTGVRLFAGTDVQNMTRIVEEDVLPPSVRVPGYPQGLESVVLSMLRRNRAQRMPSAMHAAQALEEFARTHSIATSPRALARYINTVFPYEPEKDLSLGIAEAPRPKLDVVAESIARTLDSTEELPFEDLDISNEPLESIAPAPPGIRDPMDRYFVIEPISLPRDLSLDSLEDSAGHPVVLLDAPKSRVPSDSDANDYMRDLSRRLAGEVTDDSTDDHNLPTSDEANHDDVEAIDDSGEYTDEKTNTDQE
jgi:serine/threonine protein kinase